MTDTEIIALACAIGGSAYSSPDTHCISFEVSDFLAFARKLLSPPIDVIGPIDALGLVYIAKTDPIYDARVDWIAS